ncbi:MAG: hypothetical protein ACLSBH_15330 [Coprobacillus cateniformis]
MKEYMEFKIKTRNLVIFAVIVFMVCSVEHIIFGVHITLRLLLKLVMVLQEKKAL